MVNIKAELLEALAGFDGNATIADCVQESDWLIRMMKANRMSIKNYADCTIDQVIA